MTQNINFKSHCDCFTTNMFSKIVLDLKMNTSNSLRDEIGEMKSKPHSLFVEWREHNHRFYICWGNKISSGYVNDKYIV